MGQLEKKVAIITGAGRNIGREIALCFAKEGAIVVIADVLDQDGEKVVKEIESLGSQGFFFHTDVTDPENTENLAKSVVEKFGRIDILVNNAGITKDNLLIRMKDDEWNRVISINLTGTFYCSRAVVKTMISQRSGKIINISSVVGLMGNAGQSNYSASKAGIIGMTKSLAKELASRNILVNAVAPGFVQTDMTEKLTEEQKKKLFDQIPLKRVAKPEEIAKVVKFLASSDADYITGQVISIDGGLAF
jgi:3-oxoacyl-[acyl-carrier protein] reductase